MRPIYPPTYVLLAVVLMIGLHLLAPGKQLFMGAARWLGLLLLAGGLGVVLWGAGLFRRAGTTIRPFEASSALVVRGPYRVSRNPIYAGMVCGLLGIGVMLGSITPFLVVPAFVYCIDRRFIRAEEAMLERTFGAEYVAYKVRVRRWL